MIGTQSKTVKLSLEHSISSVRMIQMPFDQGQTIASVKQKVQCRYGTIASFMRLELHSEQNKLVSLLDDDTRVLGFYSPHDGMILYVIDDNPASIHHQIEQSVEKYTISEEDYQLRPDTFRKWKQMLVQARPELKNISVDHLNPDYQEEIAKEMKVGHRCKLEAGMRGEVAYIGKIMDIGAGYYVGVRLDQPYGNSNGTKNGIRYFEAPEKYGIFIRPNKIEIGQFPVLDIEDQI